MIDFVKDDRHIKGTVRGDITKMDKVIHNMVWRDFLFRIWFERQINRNIGWQLDGTFSDEVGLGKI